MLIDADQSLVNDSDNDKRFTPLFVATFNQNVAVIKKLIENGADVNARTVDDRTALDAAISKKDAETAKVLWTYSAQTQKEIYPDEWKQ